MPGTKGHASPLPNLAALKKRLLLLPAAVLLVACATPGDQSAVSQPGETAAPPSPAVTTPVREADSSAQQALQRLVALQDRLYRVAGPLLVNNAELCKRNARNLLGFTAKTRHSYSAEYADAAQKVLGLGERLQVMGVLAGGGAARAGLKRGDILVAVEGKSMPQGEDAERDAAAILVPLVTGRTTVNLTIQRGGANMALNVPLTYACAYGIELGNADNVAAYADGYRVLVTRGMMNATQTDEELATVLAKEMAHNMLAHAARRKQSATIGGIIDNLVRARPDLSSMSGMAGVKPMPQDMDAMADKLSLYLLARAGYDINHAVPFWQRIATQYPATVLNGYTALHPATAYRVSAMEKTIKEIKVKQAAKRPLRP
ncbi:MAG TPA: M48 family metallopeptidase [Noviherbaspirillum sp.]